MNQFDDNVPFDVMDEMPEIGDLSTQEGGDVLETAYKVPLTILDAKVDRVKSKDDPKVETFIKLVLRMAIDAEGVDGNGKMAKRQVRAQILWWYNPDLYKGEWWEKKSRFDAKAFLKALGYDPAKPPKLNDSFLAELKTQGVKADILKKAKQAATGEVNEKGKKVYRDVEGEFQNEIKNYRKK